MPRKRQAADDELEAASGPQRTRLFTVALMEKDYKIAVPDGAEGAFMLLGKAALEGSRTRTSPVVASVEMPVYDELTLTPEQEDSCRRCYAAIDAFSSTAAPEVAEIVRTAIAWALFSITPSALLQNLDALSQDRIKTMLEAEAVVRGKVTALLPALHPDYAATGIKELRRATMCAIAKLMNWS